MDPKHAGSSEDKSSSFLAKGLQHRALASRASAASSLRAAFGEVHASGSRTPRTPGTLDEGAPLLADPEDDLERGSQYGSSSQSTERGREPPYTPVRKVSTMAKVKYYIPSTAWIPAYSWSLLAGDILAGLTVASMLIPQSVSYASSLAKLSPVTGLFSASIPGIVYAFMGTSRQLNVAPEAALSLLVGQAVNEILTSDPHNIPKNPDAVALAVSTVLTFQVGLISFCLGFFRLGFLDVVLSRALLRGFISAVAFVIMVEQLIPMFGLAALSKVAQPHSTLDKAIFLFHNVTQAQRLPTIVSFSALGILVGSRIVKNRFQKYWFIYRLPEVFLVVVVATVLSDEFKWDKQGIDILGSVPINTGDSFIEFPLGPATLPYLRKTTSTAVLLAVAGFLDSIVAAKQNASRYGYSISPNRELVALGMANLVGSFIPGTLPAYGSITRSKVNGDVGARTQMASLVCSGLVLLATFFLLPWLYFLPKCVLAAIICLIVFSLLAEAPHDIAFYFKMRAWVDLLLMSLTFVFTIIWNVEVGILVSVVCSLLMVVHRSSRARLTILGRIPGTDRWKSVPENPDAEDTPGVLIVRIRENLDFANTAQLKERLRRLELYGHDKHHPSEEPHRHSTNVLVFHMADVDTIDASALQIILELVDTYSSRGVGIYVTHLTKEAREAFEQAGIVKRLGENNFCENVASAMSRIEKSGVIERS